MSSRVASLDEGGTRAGRATTSAGGRAGGVTVHVTSVCDRPVELELAAATEADTAAAVGDLGYSAAFKRRRRCGRVLCACCTLTVLFFGSAVLLTLFAPHTISMLVPHLMHMLLPRHSGCAQSLSASEKALLDLARSSYVEAMPSAISRRAQVHDAAADAWVARHGRLRGVNLGGWLLLERWLVGGVEWWDTACCGAVLSPYVNTSCEEVPSEWHLSRALRERDALHLIDHFRDAFISVHDFRAIKAAGLNSVRLPIPHWLVAPSAPYHTGRGLGHVDDAVRWAEETGLKLVLDLHGTPGGQSGAQTTGREAHGEWQPSWFDADGTVRALEALARRYANRTAVVALELVNEPELPAHVLLDVYTRASRAVRAAGMSAETVALVINAYSANGVLSVFEDVWPVFNRELTPPEHPNVLVDLHLYYAFLPAPLSSLPLCVVTDEAVTLQSDLLDMAGRHAFAGEWSLRVPPPGTSAGDEFVRLSQPEQDELLRHFARKQIAELTRHGRLGGFYWAWRAPTFNYVGGPGCVWGDQSQWSLETALQRGWIEPGQWS